MWNMRTCLGRLARKAIRKHTHIYACFLMPCEERPHAVSPPVAAGKIDEQIGVGGYSRGVFHKYVSIGCCSFKIAQG